MNLVWTGKIFSLILILIFYIAPFVSCVPFCLTCEDVCWKGMNRHCCEIGSSLSLWGMADTATPENYKVCFKERIQYWPITNHHIWSIQWRFANFLVNKRFARIMNQNLNSLIYTGSYLHGWAFLLSLCPFLT